MTYCEALFDKNILQIQKLVHDIGDLSKLIHKKEKHFFYMMIVILLLIHFLQKSIKKYGLISFEYDQNNKLKFNIINDIQKEFITLQLEDILNPRKLKQ